jgi:hypothetical protein
MNLIDKSWKRILISLLFGGGLSLEIRRITNGHIKIAAVILAIIVYAILSKIHRRTQKQKLKAM